MKKVLITGGLGFLGVHCIEKWKELGWDITALDNFSSNTISSHHEICNGVRVLVKDFLDYGWGWGDNFDLVIHLASPVGPVGVLKHSGKMSKMIIDDIHHAIEGALFSDCPLLFVSTSEIYGHRDELSYLKEDDDKVLRGDFTVRNEYSQAKLLSEIALVNSAKVHPGLKYQIIRPFNISGAYQRPDNGFVLPRFVTQALAGDPITVYYDGTQRRAFTWVKDIVDGIYLTSIAKKKHWNNCWNVGNTSNEESILYLAEKVKSITGSDSKIVHVDPTELHGDYFAEAPDKIPDSTKITTLLGWSPTKTTDEIIKEVVSFYEEN